ncbi:hypothetical protein GCM10027299_21700 [Larkinella ripae]
MELKTIEQYDKAVDRYHALCQKDRSAWLQFTEKDDAELKKVKGAIKAFESQHAKGFLIAGPQCTLGECPPGLFLCDDTVGMKTEYGNTIPECFIVASGEAFAGGVQPEALADVMVTPLVVSQY